MQSSFLSLSAFTSSRILSLAHTSCRSGSSGFAGSYSPSGTIATDFPVYYSPVSAQPQLHQKESRVPLLVFLHTSPCHGMTSHLLLVLHFCTASTHHKAPLRAAEMAANGMDKVT